MKFIARLGIVCTALSLVLLVADAPAAPKPISGKLSKSGYTVIALTTNGHAKAARVSGRRFRLRPPAKSVALHLRAPNGVYAGPVVLGSKRRGSRAVLGIRSGARLGSIKVRRGYAKVRKRLAKRFGDSRWAARARKGVPIGAGVFGRVRSRPPRRPPPGDLDFDGVPSSLDVDDDGDLILDDLDRSRPTGARAAQELFDSPFLSYVLELTATETVNVNAGSTDKQIEEDPLTSTLMGGIVSDRSPALRIGFPQGAASAELDCGKDDPGTPQREGWIYCSTGTPPSKGRIFPNGPTQPPGVFPDCCDSDSDGFGTLRSVGLNTGVMDLHYTGSTADMRTGQTLLKHVTNGDPSRCPPPPTESNPECFTFSSALRYVFATVPALVSYGDAQGNTGTIQYPVVAGSPGSAGNPSLVAAGPDGKVVVSVTLWQPQRRPTSTAECVQPSQPVCTRKEWIDIGGLTYSSTVTTGPHVAPFQSRQCPQDAYSIPPGQPLIQASPVGPDTNRGLTDTLPDRPTNPGNKLTFTLNLTKCLGGLPWNPGQTTSVEFRASGQPPAPGVDAGHTSQTNVVFKRG